MTEKSKFSFKGYTISRSLIELSEEVDVEKLSIKFNSSGEIDNTNGEYKLTLKVFVTDTDNSLNIEITAEGLYSFDISEDQHALNGFFYVNSSAILFPYIRAHIATLSALSGISAITLPAMNLTALGKQLKENTITIES